VRHLTKQDQYNDSLKRLAKADEYFNQRYTTDTAERQAAAVSNFTKLINQCETLYKDLRPTSSNAELQFGFDPKETMTMQLEITQEIENIVERLDIVRADYWKLDRLEYLKQSHQLLACFSRKEVAI